MTPRQTQMLAFLNDAGWRNARVDALAGDASARRYFRVTRGAATAVVMDTPRGCVDDPVQFMHIANHLADIGLSPPRCLASDLTQGFLLLEDLGDALFAAIVANDPAQEMPLYGHAIGVLHIIQSHPAPPRLPNLSAGQWADAAMLAVTRYAAGIHGAQPDAGPLHTALSAAISQWADGPRVLILRDYHAENLLHLPARRGAAQVGLLDFQLGQLGQPCYDLVSLLQDARRDVSATVQTAMFAQFLAKTGADPTQFAASYATFGAQRALRILGIFAQLCTQSGKAGYLAMIPRVWGQLQQNLSHPALADVAKACRDALPEPSPTALATLRSQCRNSP